MEATFTKPPNRLAWRARQTGISRADAVASADAKVEEIREQTLAYVDLNIDHLRDTIPKLNEYSESVAQDIYDAGNAIFSTAATFGMDALGRAAHSLCDLMTQFEQGAPWNSGAIKLHIESILVLRKMTVLQGHAASDMLKNLSDLVNFVSNK